LAVFVGRERMERRRARGSGGFESCPVRSIGFERAPLSITTVVTSEPFCRCGLAEESG
jgi:hypothetical protein